MDPQTEVLDAYVRRWHSIRGVTAASMDGRTIGGAVTRYGATVLDEVFTALEARGLEDIAKPLQFLMGWLRRWEGDQQKQAAEAARAAATVARTQEAIAREEQRIRDEVALTPAEQRALMQRLWGTAREMGQQGVPVEERERILVAMADDAIREGKTERERAQRSSSQ